MRENKSLTVKNNNIPCLRTPSIPSSEHNIVGRIVVDGAEMNPDWT